MAKALGVSPNTVRRRLTSGLLTGEKVGNQWLINMPDGVEIEEKTDMASSNEAMANDNELVKQLREDLANANDRITFLEGHISQITNALNPAKSRPWWKLW